jgi:hypothetical protein
VDLAVDLGERAACDLQEPAKLFWRKTTESFGDVVGRRTRRFANLVAEFFVARNASGCS